MSALALGTVQFGLGYGIAGRARPVDEVEASRILACAYEAGIRRLDTAPVYGNIEERLTRLCGSNRFEIVSKFSPLPIDTNPLEAAVLVRRAVFNSLRALGEGLVGMIFHREADVEGAHGAHVWDAAVEATVSNGLACGVSRYAPAGPQGAKPIAGEMLQCPGNALDQRLPNCPEAAAVPEISVRSAFLQGLLLMPIDEAKARVPAAAAALDRWAMWCSDRAVSPLVGALSVVKGFEGVSYCLVGVDDLRQLQAIVAAWQQAAPLPAPDLACDDPAVIDPRQWSQQS